MAIHSSPSLADPDDLTALARLWHRRGLAAPALRALEVAEEHALDRAQKAHLCESRARILKRDRQFDSAHAQWETVATASPGRPDVAEELAKHLEHRRKDYASALAVVERALTALQFHETVGDVVIPGTRERLLHRRARLKRRLNSALNQPE